MKDNPNIQCACGCGGILKKYDRRGRPRKFLPSHWSKTQPNKWQMVHCENCGKSIERPRWHLRKVKHHFCDFKCAGEWATHNGIRRGANNGHYNTITVPCTGCGESVSKPHSLIMRRNGRVYCPNCVGLIRKGRKGYYEGYPLVFNETLRAKIRKRDKYICQLCQKHQNETGTLHVHHIDYDKDNNDPANLISLCNECHGQTNFGTDKWEAHLTGLMTHK